MGLPGRMLPSRCLVHSRGFTVLHHKFCSPIFTKPFSTGDGLQFASFDDIVSREVDTLRQKVTWKNEILVQSRQEAVVSIGADSRQVLNLCASNYSGLVNHPAVIQAGIDAYRTRGGGLSSARYACGFQDIHMELESKLAKFHEKEAAILYTSCYDANIGLFSALLSKEDAIISDELNHASIIDGIRLCKAARYLYKHANMEDLESKLKATQGARIRLIVSDGVFSMDANFTPLRDMRALADEYNAAIFLDECHATAIVGKTGRGIEEYFDMVGSADIINSTLGKGIGGGTGGYTVGSKNLIDLLSQRHRSYGFSHSVSPPAVAATSKALDLFVQSPAIIEKLHINTQHFRNGMAEAGFSLLGHPSHPVCPLVLGDLTRAFTQEMLDRGIYAVGVYYPIVPEGAARIRVQISSTHSPEEIDRAISAFTEVGRKLKVIEQ